MRLAGSLLIACLLLALICSPAQARRYTATRGGKQVVVHTRVAPVIAHKAVPPFYGVHVVERQPRPARARRRSR